MTITQIVVISIIGLFFILMLILSLLSDPNGIINTLKLKPTTFRLYKPKNNINYYLQIRVLFVYYYIYKTTDKYHLTIYPDKYCISYTSHFLISSKRNIIYSDRYLIVSYFSDISKPKDILNI